MRANREPLTSVETHSARPRISARLKASSDPGLPPTDLELPAGQRTPAYRFFEALPAAISFTAVGLVFILPFVDAMLGAVYVLSIVGLMFVRAMLGAVDVARGFLRYRRSARVDWAARLTDLERAMDGRSSLAHPRGGFRASGHAALVAKVGADPHSDRKSVV